MGVAGWNTILLLGLDVLVVAGDELAHCWVLRDRAHRSLTTDHRPTDYRDLVVSVDHGGGYRPLLENYTVDASILVVQEDKLLRAHGGCLGTKSR